MSLRRFWPLLLGFVALLGATNLSAHNAPGSALLLDFHTSEIGAELRLPLSELEISFKEALQSEPTMVVSRYRERLADYIRQHVVMRSPDGRLWAVEIGRMKVALAEQPVDLVVELALRPPDGAPLRQFTLHYDVISHEVMNHIALVSVRTDWNNSLLGSSPEMLGALRSFAPDLAVNRRAGTAWSGFRSLFTLGLRHIADGTDHLMFLLVLLLPAPLLAVGKGWGGYGGLRHSGSSLVKIVTAFTVGHSLTLMVGALGWLRLPSQLVEVLIAVSILVSAVHAIRPLFAGREAWIALGFGLVHGLAFATVLAEYQLDARHLAAALLAFNLGIEVMQLVVVAITVPWLVLLSRSRVYPGVRIAGAIFAGLAALGWIAQRAFDLPNPIEAIAEYPFVHPRMVVGSLAVFAVGAWVLLRTDSRTPERN